MAEPFFVVFCVEIPHPPGQSRCTTCKRDFCTGNWFVVTKIQNDKTSTWYLAGKEASCCGKHGKTIWTTADENEAKEKGREILKLFQLANEEKSEDLYAALVQAPPDFVPLIAAAEQSQAYKLN